jgi:hypothetical protein
MSLQVTRTQCHCISGRIRDYKQQMSHTAPRLSCALTLLVFTTEHHQDKVWIHRLWLLGLANVEMRVLTMVDMYIIPTAADC